VAVLSPLREQAASLNTAAGNDIVVCSCKVGIAGHDLADDGIVGCQLCEATSTELHPNFANCVLCQEGHMRTSVGECDYGGSRGHEDGEDGELHDD
jgi:hypothetical protein